MIPETFNLGVHKRTFTNYLEVIIDSSGLIMYATPSHQEKLISIAMKMYNKSREEINDWCPEEYYSDFITWLCKITKCVSVWNDMIIGSMNPIQLITLHILKDNKLYKGEIPNGI